MADRYNEIEPRIRKHFPDMRFPAGPDGTPQMLEDGVQTADADFAWLIPARCNLFSKGRNVYPTRGFLNGNDIVRIGWAWKGTKHAGRDVFRIAWGKGKHIDLWPLF